MPEIPDAGFGYAKRSFGADVTKLELRNEGESTMSAGVCVPDFVRD